MLDGLLLPQTENLAKIVAHNQTLLWRAIAMHTVRWWRFGAVGGFALSVATAVKLVRAIFRGAAGDAGLVDSLGVFALTFAMGFVCGVVAWAGRSLYDRIGMLSDSIVGVAVMIVFFLACMLTFEPALLGSKFRVGGVPMLVLAIVVGAICGPWFARDLRKASGPTD